MQIFSCHDTKCTFTQHDNCCLHHKETLKKPEIASLLVSEFVKKEWSVDQPNKVRKWS